jgi:predicted lipoprotein with Yx(FWY)xxD motif
VLRFAPAGVPTREEGAMSKWTEMAIGAALLATVAAMGDHPGVQVASRAGGGRYLADEAGKALYWSTRDSPGLSACAGPCVEKWPVFFSETLFAAGLTARDFRTITREDGTRQTTFRGYPLYYWGGDAASGDTKGMGNNGVWFLIDPANFPPRIAGWDPGGAVTVAEALPPDADARLKFASLVRTSDAGR